MLRHDTANKEDMDEVAKTGFRANAKRAECGGVLPRAGGVHAVFLRMEETAARQRGDEIPGSATGGACPPKECYDKQANADGKYGKPLPPFSWLIETGKVCALNFPIGMNPGLAKAIAVMMKLDFERAVLNRVPQIEAHPEQYFRQVFFICDEYQHFATVGENEPTGDEKFFSLSRQPKCIPIIATQSISSLKSALPGETWRTLLQTFRTKIFLALSDDYSAKIASELCGKEDQLKVGYNLSETGHDTNISFLTGKAQSNKANLTQSKTYYQQSDYRFDMKTFTELRNAQSVTIAYDGLNPMPPMFCYLKPYFNDPNKSYFRQAADGEL
jgi:hypothetical protein